jgi:hypothetical protein
MATHAPCRGRDTSQYLYRSIHQFVCFIDYSRVIHDTIVPGVLHVVPDMVYYELELRRCWECGVNNTKSMGVEESRSDCWLLLYYIYSMCYVVYYIQHTWRYIHSGGPCHLGTCACRIE